MMKNLECVEIVSFANLTFPSLIRYDYLERILSYSESVEGQTQ